METRFPENMKATLKSIREMRGYKQDEAAKMIGIATDTLRNYEQGKSYPDIPVLRKIEETYNVRYSQIIFLLYRKVRLWLLSKRKIAHIKVGRANR